MKQHLNFPLCNRDRVRIDESKIIKEVKLRHKSNGNVAKPRFLHKVNLIDQGFVKFDINIYSRIWKYEDLTSDRRVNIAHNKIWRQFK